MSSIAARGSAGGWDGWKGVALLAMPIGTVAQAGLAASAPRIDVASALCLLACAACACRACREGAELPIAARSALIGGSLLWFASDYRLAFLALTVSGLGILWAGPGGEARRAAWLWLALSAHGLWGVVALKIASPLVVPAETRLVGWAAKLVGVEAAVAGTRIDGAGGWYIYVVEGCSSLHGISLDLLIWASSLSLMGAAVRRRHAAAFAASALGFVILNTVRVLLMARSEGAYAFWHDGDGATAFGLALTGLALGSVAAAERPGAPRRP